MREFLNFKLVNKLYYKFITENDYLYQYLIKRIIAISDEKKNARILEIENMNKTFDELSAPVSEWADLNDELEEQETKWEKFDNVINKEKKKKWIKNKKYRILFENFVNFSEKTKIDKSCYAIYICTICNKRYTYNRCNFYDSNSCKDCDYSEKVEHQGMFFPNFNLTICFLCDLKKSEEELEKLLTLECSFCNKNRGYVKKNRCYVKIN